MLEFEKKVMLTKAEYDFLKEHWQALAPTAVQINHYYDTDDFELSRRGITCRIREKDGVCTATVKEHRIKGSDCSVEKSRSVTNRYDDSLFKGMGLRYQGSLETLRTIYESQPGIRIMLDRNSYLGTVDYELEIEYDKEFEYLADAELEQIISEMINGEILNSPKAFRNRVNQGKSKSGRFFERKTEAERWIP